MSFDIITVNGFSFHKWEIGPSTFLVWPEKGARLMNWNIHMADGSVRDVIYWPSDADYSKPAKIRGGNPILFPFVARTFNQGKEGEWIDTHGKTRAMPRHGFARDGDFIIDRKTPTGFNAIFKPKPEDQFLYPYAYEFSVFYQFHELYFTVALTLKNLDKQPIPWCAGHHFYFNLPWHDGCSRSDYEIHIPTKKAFLHAADGKLSLIKNIAATHSLDNPDLIDRIHCQLKSNKIKWGPKSGEEDVTIRIGNDPIPSPWTTLTTWTESDTSPFYCIEPWMGPPNSIENQTGTHYVDPEKSETFIVDVSLM